MTTYECLDLIEDFVRTYPVIVDRLNQHSHCIGCGNDIAGLYNASHTTPLEHLKNKLTQHKVNCPYRRGYELLRDMERI